MSKRNGLVTQGSQIKYLRNKKTSLEMCRFRRQRIAWSCQANMAVFSIYPSLKEVKAVLLFLSFQSLFFQPVRTRNLYSFFGCAILLHWSHSSNWKGVDFFPFDGWFFTFTPVHFGICRQFYSAYSKSKVSLKYLPHWRALQDFERHNACKKNFP